MTANIKNELKKGSRKPKMIDGFEVFECEGYTPIANATDAENNHLTTKEANDAFVENGFSVENAETDENGEE